MKITSKITGKLYEQQDMCHILNPIQAALYIKNGATLYDLLLSRENKLIYVFNRSDTKHLYDQFCNYRLK